MRDIKTHKIDDQDRQPEVLASDDRTIGGAPDAYKIIYSAGEHVHIPFVTYDRPGVTNEALLAIVIDRLEGFQAGPFPCEENADALTMLNIALDALKARTVRNQLRQQAQA